MRDIKFRAWAGNPKSMRTVCELVESSNYFQISTGYILGNVMQFTGLYDKNGKEIYEGDIVIVPSGYGGDNHYEQTSSPIKYDEAEFYVDTKNYSDFSWGSLEVIGNIHENPELLEEKP